MKWLLVLVVCCGSLFAQESMMPKAVEGAKLLHSTMRDPDSFKISRAWIMSVAKFGDVAVCFDYFSKNGFGGMNAAHADYAPHSHKDFKTGKFILNTYEEDEYFEGFRYRCGAAALKHGYIARDVTEEVKAAITQQP